MAATGRQQSLILNLLLHVVFVGALAVGTMPLLLLVVATRASSRLFAIAVLVLVLVVVCWTASRIFKGLCFPAWGIGIGFASAGISWGLALAYSPAGIGDSGSALVSQYRGPVRVSRFSPTWIVDEADQIRMGGVLLPYVDPIMTSEQATIFSMAFNAEYAEMTRSADFIQIGSVLGESYGDMLGMKGSISHAYVYHPDRPKTQRLPVIVFFHGWLGNMKAYAWSWSHFAEKNGFIVICPTFKNGIWNGPEAVETISWIQGLIKSDERCDESSVYVVGLSNGGTGVVRWAEALPGTFRGLVFISPVMQGTDTKGFAAAVGDERLLIVHGSSDTRIPSDYVKECVARMTRRGLAVTSLSYDHEDHCLILSSKSRLHRDMFSWMNDKRQPPKLPDDVK